MAFTMKMSEVIASDATGLLTKHPSWERVPLAHIAEIVNGAPFDSAFFSSESGMPLVRIRDVQEGVTTTYYRGDYDAAYLVRRGDLLIGMDGDFNLGLWRSHDALLNQRVCKVTPNERFYSKTLLARVLPGYLSAINAHTPSITVKHLSSKTVGEIELPLPPRAEQDRIVAKLEELLSDLDAGVAELQAAQKKLTLYRQSLLKAAVEGALTADWRRQHPPKETGEQLLQRILAERRAGWEARQLAKFEAQGKAPPKGWQESYPEPVKPDTADLPSLPQSWVWASLDALIAQGPQNGLYLPATRYGTGTPILRIDDYQIGWHRTRAELNLVSVEADDKATYSLRAGDLVINRVNSMTHLGKSLLASEALEGVLFESNMMRVRLSDSVSSAFTTFYLGSEVGRARLIRDAKWAVNQASINQRDVRRTPVPVPPLKEQVVIAMLLCTQHEAVAAQTETIRTSLRQAAAQRQNILRAAFSGQLVPQDPNDEPASALLERIRAERAAPARARPHRLAKKTRETA